MRTYILCIKCKIRQVHPLSRLHHRELTWNCNEHDFQENLANITNNYQAHLKCLHSAQLVAGLEASPLAVLE